MSKYTELLSEYLENGRELPAVFDQIDGFKELFIGYYADYEIGFETEDLFALKLENIANLVIPNFIEKNKLKQFFIQELQNPQKIRKTIHDIGKLQAANWVLPFNSNIAEPSAKSETEETQNIDSETETGYTANEVREILDSLKNDVNNGKIELLKEFRTLFMMIY